ncbi:MULTISPECIES: pirin family protein [unclassified Clostridium]|uniref:pirin family protein n=1 Tax=unclassified Clostridium TaxID=2614128 RepID=UPI0025BE380F|nr:MULTISPECIES: pirin family protein [unclassified Clostridium]
MIKIINGEAVKDGAGVKLNRVIGSRNLDNADPFYLLDEFRSDNKSDYIAGFPMHPHRGIETITYMIEGSFKHRDSKGNEGVLNSGDVQWMTTGRGILHEEMPVMEDGKLWGYQLWLNLPKEKKMIEPKYRHISNEEIPVIKEKGVLVKLISGTYKDKNGATNPTVPVDYIDVRINGGRFEKEGMEIVLLYAHSGEINVEAQGENVAVKSGNMCFITGGGNIEVTGEGGFLYISGNPLREPVARYGPFIMNTSDEIIKAIDDYNNGVFDK